MIITIHTYKSKNTFKKVDYLQWEGSKLNIYQKKIDKPIRSYYQYDIKFFCVMED